MKYKSCKDIESSLYIAPNEIRACCQRFFYKNEMRGDAKLLDIKDGKIPSAQNISYARSNLFESIQKNESESCNGCPFLYETDDKPNFDNQINHLSIEHHSVCNLRCTYCSETYYGGKRSKYDVAKFIQYLNEQKSFKNCKQVVWGGGEPTLDKTFDIIVEEINKYADPKLYHRVFTNSARYHPSIVKFLRKGLIKIVTSIDAGTQDTFKKVRGRDKFYEVLNNLKSYSSINPSHVTVKYIFTDDNLKLKEIDSFVENCTKFELSQCCYQISMNYKNDKLLLDYLKSILYLMSKLKNNNIKKFFCDDHIAARFKILNDNEKSDINEFCKTHNISDIIINNNLKNISIFGAGDITNNIINKTLNDEEVNKIEIFDSDINKVGKTIRGIKIQHSKEIVKSNNDIYISVAQSYDEIYSYLMSKKISPNKIVSGLFV